MIDTLSLDWAWRLAGWTMVHYLWVGTLIGLGTYALRALLPRSSPSLRYAGTLACFFALATAPMVIAVWLGADDRSTFRGANAEAAHNEKALPIGLQLETANPQPPSANIARANAESPIIDLAETPLVVDATGSTQPAFATPSVVVPLEVTPSVATSRSALNYQFLFDRITRFVPWLWIVGAPFTFLLLATGIVGAGRLRRNARLLESGQVFDTTKRLRSALRLTCTVAVAVSDRVLQPVLVGIFRPLILLPPAAVSGWSAQELEMALLHELAHVRRWDNLVNLIQRLVESVLFFQPSIWLVSRSLRIDREHCCDALVVKHTGAPHAYAELLVSVAQSSLSPQLPSTAVALARHPLSARIRRILQLEDDPMLVSKGTLGVVVVVFAATAGMLLWQPAPQSTAQESDKEYIELKEETESRAVLDGESALEKPDTERTQNSAEMTLQVAGDPRVFSDPGAARAWKATQEQLIKSHLVLDGAMNELLNQRKQNDRLPMSPPESWLMKALEVSSDSRGTRIKLTSASKSKEELDHILRAVAKSYVQARREQGRGAADAGENSPFLPLDQQRIADLAYRMLNVEIAPLDKDLLPIVKQRKFAGGVMIESIALGHAMGGGGFGGGGESSPFQSGDILVGLHGWPTSSFDQLAEVLRRDDLMEFSPLKFYVLRPVYERPASRRARGGGRAGTSFGGGMGEFGGDGMEDEFGGAFGETEGGGYGGEFGGGGFGSRSNNDSGRGNESRSKANRPKYELYTGRFSINRDTWQAEQQRLQRATKHSQMRTPFGYQRIESADGVVSWVYPPSKPDSKTANKKKSGEVNETARSGALSNRREAAAARHKELEKQRRQLLEQLERGNNSQGKTLLYDGRSFEDWSSQWRHELKVQKRTEAIEALAAFGRAGYGEKAVDALLDVAAEYDFEFIHNPNSTNTLKVTVLNTLIGENSINESIWLPMLWERYKAEPARYRYLLVRAVGQLQAENEDTLRLVLKLADDQNAAIRQSVAAAIFNSPLETPTKSTIEVYRRLLDDADPAVCMEALQYQAGILHLISSGGENAQPRVPGELLRNLWHENRDVRSTASNALIELMIPLSKQPKLCKRIAEVLVRAAENPAEVRKKGLEASEKSLLIAQVAALRALRAIPNQGLDQANITASLKKLMKSESATVAIVASITYGMLREGEFSLHEGLEDLATLRAKDRDPNEVMNQIADQYAREFENAYPGHSERSGFGGESGDFGF